MISGQIEILVVVTAVLLVARFILDFFRRRSRNQVLTFIVIFLGNVRFLIHYTIGIMQLTKKSNDLYQVWAVVLVTLQYSVRAVRPSGIFGKQTPLQDIMSSFWAGNLLGTRSSVLMFPLWLLWSLNSVRIVLGFSDTVLIHRRHHRNLMLLTAYMRNEHLIPHQSPDRSGNMRNEQQIPQSPNRPGFMQAYNYRYLVLGENKQKIESHPPRYIPELTVIEKSKFITTKEIWERRELNEFRDLCISFALFKLLCRRFYGLQFHEATQQKTKDFVLRELLGDNANYERAFKIIKVELAFLNDLFYTRFAVMFSTGFPVLRFLLSLSVTVIAIYLARIFHRPPAEILMHNFGTIELAVTWIILVILIIKEAWEMLNYVVSDWTKVVLISKYVQKPWWMRCSFNVEIVKFLCNIKVVRRWHGYLWQYNLLQSFRRKLYNPTFNCITGVCVRRLPGGRANPRVKLPIEVKQAIGESIRYLLSNNHLQLTSYLSNAASSLDLDFDGSLILNNLKSEARKILVWHVATCYCEIKLIKERANGNSPRFCSLDSPFFLENLDSLSVGLQSRYNAATALSQYSAHLLAYSRYLVPSRPIVSAALLLSTIRFMRKSLHNCRSWSEVRKKLKQLANEEDNDEEEEGKTLLKQGVILGRELMNQLTDTTIRWQFLKKFWAGYLLYFAASVKPNDHKESLYYGGEFLTHVWALLSHSGALGTYNKVAKRE